MSTEVVRVLESLDVLSMGFTMRRGINDDRSFEHPFLLRRVDTNDAPGGASGGTDWRSTSRER